MSLRINTNVAALNSYNNLSANQTKLEGAFQQLSSGLRINKAADDAAGLSIAQGLTSQINGLTQAVSNANDGINVAQIADGALGTTQDILQRMRSLVVKAGNEGTQDSKSLSAITQEITNLNTQLNNISSQTKFGQTNLLDGSYNKNFQVGANGGDTIALDLSTAGVKSDNIANTGVDLNSLSIVKGIPPTNVAGLTVDSTTNKIGTVAAGGTFTALTGTGTAAAGFAGAFGSTYVAVDGAPAAAGTNITISAKNSDGTFDVTDAFSHQALGKVSVDSATGNFNITDMNGNSLATVTSSFNDQTFADTSITGGNAETAGSTLGKALAAVGATLPTAGNGSVTGSADTGWSIKSSGTEIATVQFNNGVYTVTSGTKTSRIDTNKQVSSATEALANYSSSNATSDLKSIDKAIDGISKARSQIGAVQNQLNYTVSNLNTAITNVTASRSNLTDADLAQQVTAMTQSQILTQAATSVLAQANSAPQAILKLLQ